MTFETLWPALLLLVVPPLVWWSRGRAPGAGPRHRAAAAALRAAAVALAVLAATQPTWWRPGRSLAVVHLVDASWSVDPEARGAIADWIRRAESTHPPDASTLLLFGADTRAVASPGEIGAAGRVDDSETDLAAALEAARAHFPRHGLRRIVLASDGRGTSGGARLGRTLSRLREEGVKVDTVSLPSRLARNAVAAALELPEDARAGEPVEATARVESVTAEPARVEVWSGERLLASQDVLLDPGRNDVRLDVALPDEGINALELRVRALGDAYAEDDVLPRVATAGPRQRVLYVEGRPASARYLRRALEQAGLEVVAGGPEAARADRLAGLDAVILSDVPARRLSPAFQAALQEFVADGGGLVLVGGESVYGREGYSGTVVEATLPVHFRIREEMRDLALMIVLDKSYSMKGPKMELAKEATKAALDLLEERHRFGVVSFDWDPYVSVPLQPATNKPAIAELIGRIRASAQTNIFPALEEAFEQLAASDAKVKHVILLSDGRSYPDDYEQLVDRMREAEITVSTVAVGAEADRELLAAIAAWGLGRRYAIEDASRVQQIFVEETRRAVQATLVEEPFTPIPRRPSTVLEGIDLGAAPPLLGYVSTQPRDAAEVLLESSNGAPVLARWRFGLGTAVAFTSDAKDRWAADWLAWPGYGRFWGQVVRSALRRQPATESLEVTRDGDLVRAVATLRAATGRSRDGLRLRLVARRDDGFERALPLPQVGLGRYATAAPLPGAGEGWRFRLEGAGDASPQAALAPRDRAERRLGPPDAETLGRIAATTGGRFGPAAEEALRRSGESGRMPVPLLPWLAGAALAVWLLDVAVRRGPWFWRRWAGEAEPLGARPATTASPTPPPTRAA